MRIFRAKKDIIPIGKLVSEATIIYKGTLFHVDMQDDLPGKLDPELFKEAWQELELYNNYGQVKLTPKY